MNKSLGVLTGAVILACTSIPVHAESAGDTATRFAAECDAKAKAGGRSHVSCASICKKFAASLKQPMQPAQESMMLRMRA